MRIFGKKEQHQVVEPEITEQVSGSPPKETATGRLELNQARQEAMEAGVLKGREDGAREANERAAEIIGLCESASPDFPLSAVRNLILEGVSIEEARQKILERVADRAKATGIVSTVSPTSTGGKNPLIVDAERRAEPARKGGI